MRRRRRKGLAEDLLEEENTDGGEFLKQTIDGVCIDLRTLGARSPGTEFSLRWLLDSASL